PDARGARRTDVAQAVADRDRAGTLDRQLIYGAAKQLRARLAALAADFQRLDLARKAAVGMVRTDIDAVEHAVLLGEQRLQPAENAVEIAECDSAARDLRAVGDADREETAAARRRDRGAGAGDERDVLRFEDALQAGFLVEHAVDVEENRGPLVG